MKKAVHQTWVIYSILGAIIIFMIGLFVVIIFQWFNRPENMMTITTIEGTSFLEADLGEKLSQEEILIVTGEYPPYVSETLENKGIYYQIVTEAFKSQGIHVKIEFYPWNRCLNMVDTGMAWATFPYMQTKERLTKYYFSDALHKSGENSFVLFYYKPNKDFSSYDGSQLKDLNSFQVGGLYNYFYIPVFENAGINLDISDSETEVFLKLMSGRIDFVPSDRYVAKYLIEKNYPDQINNFSSIDITFNEELNNYELLTSQQNSKATWLINVFNQGLIKIQENGIYDELIEGDRYLNVK